MDGCFAVALVVGSTQSLAVNGDDFTFDQPADDLYPFYKTGLELNGINSGKNPLKCIRGRNAARKI